MHSELCTCVVISVPPGPCEAYKSSQLLQIRHLPLLLLLLHLLLDSTCLLRRTPKIEWLSPALKLKDSKFSQYIQNAVLGHMQQIMIDKAYITSHMNLTSICKRTYSINIILCNANRSLLCFHEMCLWDRVLKDSVVVISKVRELGVLPSPPIGTLCEQSLFIVGRIGMGWEQFWAAFNALAVTQQ